VLFNVPPEEVAKSKIPHEVFLTNLIGNHILWFVASLGVVRSLPYPIMLVPIVSVASLTYTLWRAGRAFKRDPWFVACHWQIAARRSKLFLAMLGLLAVVSGLGWVGHTYLGMMKEAVFALIGGVGLLPVMVTMLVLIIMESESLHRAGQGRLPPWVLKRYPNADAQPLEELDRETIAPHLEG